jgi:WD40 repeat protein
MEPLFHVAYDCHDGIYIAFSELSGENIYVHDLRKPNNAIIKLKGHLDFISQIGWHPLKRHKLLSTSDDCKALLWSLRTNHAGTVSYTIDYTPIFNMNLEINDFCWSQDFLGLSFNQSYALLPPKKIIYD